MTHILMSWFKESTERQKTRFVKKNCRKCRPTQSRIKKVNDHTRILRKKRFPSSFDNLVRYLARLNNIKNETDELNNGRLKIACDNLKKISNVVDN